MPSLSKPKGIRHERRDQATQKQIERDDHIYCHHTLVENAFLHLKHWRYIATPYAKNAASFLAAVHLRCLMLWLSIS